MIKKAQIFIILLLGLIAASCIKDGLYSGNDDVLRFSRDTVFFDTVFTKIGTATQILKVKNPLKESIEIDQIRLGGGTVSVFQINVDGISASIIKNVEIKSKDSLFIFIQAKIDPVAGNLPVLVRDSIIFTVNGNQQNVQLEAVGQNVTLIDGETIETRTFSNIRPYLIYNSMLVDSGHVLTIEAGATLYFHKGSSLIVAGTINANGTSENEITFRGDRLDDVISGLSYDQLPNQWGQIWLLHTSVNNSFSHCHIRNATIGLQVGVLDQEKQPDVELESCIINNNSYSGIFAINAKINAQNCQITNSSVYNFAAVVGGEYYFNHCTFANYYDQGRTSEPSIGLANEVEVQVEGESVTFSKSIDTVYFGNCIIDGNIDNELGVNETAPLVIGYYFEHCYVKLNQEDNEGLDFVNRFKNSVYSGNINFKSLEPYEHDFNLTEGSVCIDKGKAEIGSLFPTDLNNRNRNTDDNPDLGAYELAE